MACGFLGNTKTARAFCKSQKLHIFTPPFRVGFGFP
ncbi:hypothetical protein SBA3_3030017 [Candidatus Sulfopaludibacter sp. SbA3]|nr:hypothetical protein SBA3_3030017 [Candidatus Sulfopaludibacter sp. SbA3]